MADQPQLYLVLPPVLDPASFGDALAAVLDTGPVACLRLHLATRDAGAIGRAADAVREIAHGRDVAVVVAEHLAIAEAHGLDGVHLAGGRGVRAARTALGPDRIVGAFCGASRHDGMVAGEAGADYVAFGPVVDEGLGGAEIADRDLFAWWSEMIEVPVVAEGVATPEVAAALAPVADFLALSPAIWEDDAAARIAAIRAASS